MTNGKKPSGPHIEGSKAPAPINPLDTERSGIRFRSDSFTCNFYHWAKLDLWDNWEAAHILAGDEPPRGDNARIASNRTQHVLDAIERAVKSRSLRLVRVTDSQLFLIPAEVIAWAKEKGFLIPPDLEEQTHVNAGLHLLRVERDQAKAALENALARIDELQAQIATQAVTATANPTAQTTNVWPWGRHETNLLRKLAGAAERLWKHVDEGGLYDPADPTSAPTNEQVEKWLEENGVTAKRVREIMAQILRVDGLATGPRK